jgi:poly(3-hydroxybutyrate) depolymerase
MSGGPMNGGALHERERRRQALLDELRRLHRAEPAPAELRQRLLERTQEQAGAAGALRRAFGEAVLGARAGWLARGLSFRVALGALALVLVGVAVRSASRDGLGGEADSASPPEIALGPEPRGSAPVGIEPGGSPSVSPPVSPPVLPGDARESAPPGEAPGHESVRFIEGRPSRPCPLAALPRGAVRRPQHSSLPGFTAHTFEQTLPSCGTITRRYLELVPPGLARRTRAPVVIVLHDAGEAAETLHARRSRLNFEDIAQRNAMVLIYANAAPGLATSAGVADSGAWQTDTRTHGEIDDEDYLRRIVEDLGTRDVIDGNTDVFLVGQGDGASMALEAAVRSRGLYVGVAAFAPTNLAFTEPALPRASASLSRVMIVVDAPARGTGEAWHLGMTRYAQRWAAALDLEQKVAFRAWNFGDPRQPTGSLQRFDVSPPATGSSGVRIYLVEYLREGVVKARPSALHAWDYLTGVDGADPDAPADSPERSFVPADLPDLSFVPVVPDGHSVFREDAEGAGYPSLVLDDELVVGSPPGQRPAPDPD